MAGVDRYAVRIQKSDKLADQAGYHPLDAVRVQYTDRIVGLQAVIEYEVMPSSKMSGRVEPSVIT